MTQNPPRLDTATQRVFELVIAAGLFDPLLEQLIEGVGSDVPPFREDPELYRALRQMSQASVRGLEALAHGATRTFEVPPEALQLARLSARQGVSVEQVIKAFSTARQVALSVPLEMFSSLEVPPEDAVAIAIDTGRLLLWWADANLAAMVSEHAREREASARGAHARRLDVARAIIVGRETNLAKASEVLGHSLSRWHVAAILYSRSDQATAGDGLRETARRLSATYQARPLVLEPDPQELWLWLSADERIDLTVLATHQQKWPSDVEVVLGSAERGAEGFRISHLQARATRRFAELGNSRGPYRFDAIALGALSSGEPELLRHFVRSELGELAGPTKDMARLRETLAAYFIENLQVSAAAIRLSVHQNTLRYRLHQCEAALGHPVTERRLPVEIALTLARALEA